MNEALKAARVAKGVTQQDMAEHLGYRSKSGYCMVERGTNQPSLRVAMLISELLERPLEVLFPGALVHESATSQHSA